MTSLREKDVDSTLNLVGEFGLTDLAPMAWPVTTRSLPVDSWRRACSGTLLPQILFSALPVPPEIPHQHVS